MMAFPRWQNHRGYRLKGALENTLEAFITSKQQGYEMVELDVQLSLEQIPVVCHDNDLQRVASDSRRIGELSVAELHQLAAIPTLDQILSSSETPNWINIELKCSSFNSYPLEHRVLEVINRNSKQVILSSFNPFVLYRCYKFAPQIPRALLVTLDRDDPANRIYLRKMWFRALCKPHYLNMEHRFINPDLIAQMEHRGIKVVAWTVNEQVDAEKLQKMGVVSMITDSLPPIS
ncbi:MAG: glycerophosphodiester phosphodiesterase [Bdellovibrionales bacterium]|nr:glycerophosphodiester phosphodiesterase [Bdellovibrionales bacterium]